ncbi:methyl-accepting chemotaxis protein [Clostridium sp. JS66]|uniref:methyl-accepting chemotaxis protein n=1 Tax=Clostridium sp. JS66 TaxID=3064705 RepID=UPI00298D751C|nr:methyl-accepting chemotaxis protein [Clostridium sp. JS66]WPC43103.1 methyl-accepting chemotaxis protein [Clostridium sp. JS66]
MDKSFLSKSKSIKFKVLIVPLIIIFLVIFSISTLCIFEIKSKLIRQMEVDGTSLAKQISSEMGKNSNSMDLLNSSIETRIKTLGDFIGANPDKVNNEYLLQLSKQFQVDEINVTDSSGKIIYSNLQSSLGSVFDNKHISYVVLTGEKTELMENIRKSRENNNYYKYGYVRKPDGGIVQIGILANTVQKLSTSLETQTLIDELIANNKEIVYSLYIAKDLKIVAHSDKDRIGKTVDDEGSKAAAVQGKVNAYTYKYKGKIEVYDVAVPVYKNGAHIGAIDIGLSTENVHKTINNMIIITTIIAIIAFAIFSIIMLIVAKKIINSLNALVKVSKKIANGELDNKIEILSNDEIGILAGSFKSMSDSLKTTIGNLKNEASRVSSMSSDLSNNAEQMAGAADEVTSAVQDVTSGATKQANDLVDVVDNISNLSEELQNIYSKISCVKESSQETEEKAKVGKSQIEILLKSIENIKESFDIVSDKIANLNSSVSQVGSITDVINEISEQTNLLALNAAIEAARAGEAGKGFAVVAEEVRTLAEQSQESTGKIQKLIQSISSETSNVMSTSEQVKNLLGRQKDTVNITVASFEDMLNASAKISPLVQDTYKSIEKTMESKETIMNKVESVTAVSQETSAASEEISASSEEMLANTESVSKFASELNEVAQELNLETNKFKI